MRVVHMSEPWLRLPVTCPRCAAEELFNIPVAIVAAALLRGAAIEFHVRCHDLRWSADPGEIQQLREYLASVEVIDLQRVSLRRSPPLVRAEHGDSPGGL
jgi:hypothetical protein